MKAQILVVAVSALIMSCGGSDFSEDINSEKPDVTTTDSGVPDSNADTGTINPDAGTDTATDTTSESFPDSASDTTSPVDTGTSCTAGSTDCLGKIPRFCDQNGVWQNKTECQFLCDKALCKGHCVPGTKQCNNKELQLCDANGDWQHLESCAMSCDQNATTPVCVGHWCCDNIDHSDSFYQVRYSDSCRCKANAESCTATQTSSCVKKSKCCMMNISYPEKCMCANIYHESECDKAMIEADALGLLGSQWNPHVDYDAGVPASMKRVDHCPVQ